jgi:hypothetical protein
MRTTIEISDDLFRQLKRKAADEGTTIRNIVESALRVYLGKSQSAKGISLIGKQNEVVYCPEFASMIATPFLI